MPWGKNLSESLILLEICASVTLPFRDHAVQLMRNFCKSCMLPEGGFLFLPFLDFKTIIPLYKVTKKRLKVMSHESILVCP